MKKSSNKIYDAQVSIRVKEMLDEFNLTEKYLAEVLNVSYSTINDIIRGRSPWRLYYLVEIAIRFGKPIDYLVFGDTDYIAKFTAAINLEMKNKLRKHYIDEGDLISLKRLENENFWDIPSNSMVAEPAVKYKQKK